MNLKKRNFSVTTGFHSVVD